ncbi:hypothetical protein PSUB009319_26740 [Ralstonia sp. SET104]|nr:hypothetical protein PSUB009319_26740 [Ralstonia sp. SET104]
MQGKLIATRDPGGAFWQLGPLPPKAGHLILIGWQCATLPTDSGVPEPIATILAQAVVSVATVSFLTSETSITDSGRQYALGSGGIAEYLRSRWMRAPTQVTLQATTDAQTAIRLFDDSGYSWHLQGQVAILSTEHADIASLDRKTVLSLIGPDWTMEATALTAKGITAVLRPGVDGAVIGVLCLDDTFAQALTAALERETNAAGFGWTMLTETEFENALSCAN